MLAKIWENEVNRIDNVRLSIIEWFFRFVVYANVPMRKIYGSDSVPEKVIKILSITSGLTEVLTPRKFRPREDFPHMAGKSEQSWRNFQRWGKIWTKKPARFRSRLSPVIFSE